MLDAVSAAVVLADEAGRVIRMNSYAHKVFRGRPATLAEVGLEARAGEQTVRRMDASTVTASVSVTTIDPGLRVLTVTEWHGHHEYGRLDLNAFGVGTWDWHIPSGDLNFDRRWLEMLGYGEGELDYDLEAWALSRVVAAHGVQVVPLLALTSQSARTWPCSLPSWPCIL